MRYVLPILALLAASCGPTIHTADRVGWLRVDLTPGGVAGAGVDEEAEPRCAVRAPQWRPLVYRCSGSASLAEVEPGAYVVRCDRAGE